MKARDEEVLIKSTESHRLLRGGDVWDSLIPVTTNAPSYLIRTIWRIESKDQCDQCGEFRCRDDCSYGEPGHESWEPQARITITQPRAPEWPFRVDMEFGGAGLSSTNDPQTMIWLSELLREVASESAAAFDIPVVPSAPSGVGFIADEVAS